MFRAGATDELSRHGSPSVQPSAGGWSSALATPHQLPGGREQRPLAHRQPAVPRPRCDRAAWGGVGWAGGSRTALGVLTTSWEPMCTNVVAWGLEGFSGAQPERPQ